MDFLPLTVPIRAPRGFCLHLFWDAFSLITFASGRVPLPPNMANTTLTRSSPPPVSSDDASVEPSLISVPIKQPHILKRQRSTETLPSTLPDATNLPEHTAKKLKAEALVAKKSVAAPGTFFVSRSHQPQSQLQPLNSVPFSMAAFRDALTEEEKSLLSLECDTMGRSWYVCQN